ncbi:cytochrome-c peroxidase [Flavobacterium sufflavum]|uniref:Cytochrome-c peroxidase n=1 Tax=Flavobacterium sufflavum TaxID=1921138 RepID=A0A437KYF7_9FLAO|nr:cytochrome c peroxidase [Flavobacterium sufflavum]RVT77605.1 cytochrome-c peroxidase [Flavobacterium sufflavum]
MKKTFFFLLLLVVVSCQEVSKTEQVKQLFQADITLLVQSVTELETLIKSDASQDKLQKQFLAAHQNYKRIEVFSEYYFPEVSKAINGPALPEFEENDGLVLAPQGFQVVEEFLFPAYDKKSKAELLKEIGILSANLKRLNRIAETNELTDAHVFDALRLEVFRIISMGITGFDSPVAQKSISETVVSLEGIQQYYQLYATNDSDAGLKIISQAIRYLKANPDFNRFDRATFIQNYANPLSRKLYQSQKDLKIPFFNEMRGLKTNAETLFDKEVFDEEAFSGFPDYKTTKEKATLGKLLFKDPILSGDNSRSCASCHHADKAFTDGLEKALSFDGKSFVKRNTPTLTNIAFQRVFFSDSRVNYLEDQAVAVITNADEMHGSLEAAAEKLKKNQNYIQKFEKAFPQKGITAFEIKNALASYIRTLSKFDSKFDAYMRDEVAFTANEKAGFNLFAGKAKCATCHFIPLTNGTVPPNFMKSESEVLGVPDVKGKLDADLGKYNLTKAIIHQHSFKTPTIRNAALTAPYMHNGVFKTLEEVVNFYNEGGGKGLGFSLENQTLPEDKLNLTDLEKKQLVDFMKTLTDKKYLK